METDRLRYFCAIAEAGSLTAAAAVLNVSHSGLSKAMSVLQSELKQQLFRPLGRGLELTDAGRDVYKKSKEILAEIEKLKESKPLHHSGMVKVGMTEIFALSISGPLATELHGAGLHADYYELDSGEAEKMVSEGRLDFALTFVPLLQNDLEYLKIKSVQMGVFGASAKFAKMPFSQVPFVIPNEGMSQNPLSLKSRDGWPAEVQRKVQYGAGSLSLALQIVNEGLAVAFIPKFLAAKNFIELNPGKIKSTHMNRDLFLLKRKNSEESKAMKIAAKVLRTRC
ncbi:MAG: hypothetical protein K0R29_1545 [Pseudobdellovibrio sp.]|jgi:DNA-binding transcriptional LysR family regulator|nr:hypothetical protein [Pseudobdellovibrio sp.]